MINFQVVDDIQVDYIVCFGSNCQVAYHLKRNNLRFHSNPFDWQVNYSLDTVINLLKTKKGGGAFYNKCYEDKNRASGPTTGIIDETNGMISKHDYPRGLPIEKAPIFFKKKYGYKFKRLNKILKAAKRICILTNRNITIEEMQNFIKEFGKIYTWEYLYFINIYDTKDEKIENVDILKNHNVTYIRYCFNNEHPDGRNEKQNTKFWLGNIQY